MSFPNDPNMPGMLQVEALVQMSALIVLILDGNQGEVAYLTSGKKFKWFKKVLPGVKFEMFQNYFLLNVESGHFMRKVK